jgi:hypothetical protein
MAPSRILIGSVLLLSLCAWAHYSNPYPDLGTILANPHQFAGQHVAVFVEARIVEKTGDGFVLVQRGNHLHVRADVGEAPAGEFVAVEGVFLPPDQLQATAWHIARGRRWKILVSLVPALLLIVLLPLALRFDRQKRIFTLRRPQPGRTGTKQ